MGAGLRTHPNDQACTRTVGPGRARIATALYGWVITAWVLGLCASSAADRAPSAGDLTVSHGPLPRAAQPSNPKRGNDPDHHTVRDLSVLLTSFVLQWQAFEKPLRSGICYPSVASGGAVDHGAVRWMRIVHRFLEGSGYPQIGHRRDTPGVDRPKVRAWHHIWQQIWRGI